jgi:serine/threonine protein kinase
MSSSLVGTEINDGQYTITKYIASGSYGDVYVGTSKDKETVALKIPIKTDTKNGEKYILEELKIYKRLHKNKCPDKIDIHIPKINIVNDKDMDKSILVMDLLGDSLDVKLQKSKSKRMPLKNVILLAIQMIEAIKHIHSTGYIHRDLKPDNFVMDINNERLYCIDFGLSKKYSKTLTKNHKFCGTARYASIAAHKGYEQCRKDDLEAIAYILIYLFNGNLKWQNMKVKDKEEKYKLIMKRKTEISNEILCNNLPREFLVYLNYVRELSFNEEPLYDMIIQMFKRLLKKKKLQR